MIHDRSACSAHVAIFNLIYAYFTTEIILKQLFTSVSVIIGDNHLDIGIRK